IRPAPTAQTTVTADAVAIQRAPVIQARSARGVPPHSAALPGGREENDGHEGSGVSKKQPHQARFAAAFQHGFDRLWTDGIESNVSTSVSQKRRRTCLGNHDDYVAASH